MSFTPAELKNVWLDFFKKRGHKVLPSMSLVPPKEDQSTLFINSGLCAIKKDFAKGKKGMFCKKLFTSVQRVVRTVDITSIEKDAWHSTYFEMLGNFSIGGYFKREAIEYAFEFLCSVLKIDPKKLVITIYEADFETEQIWKEVIGESASIVKMGQENFWEIGEGPCGPCTEIYYDRGEDYDPYRTGLDLIKDGISNERYIEIWNIVFSQYWAKDGEYSNLESQNIDTGAGLERIITILENAENIYCSSILSPMIMRLEKLSGKEYCRCKGRPTSPDLRLTNSNFQVVVDHVRTVTLLLGEGVVPSSKGRGYIVRKLLRRTTVCLIMLGIKNILAAILELVDLSMIQIAPFSPHILKKIEDIKDTIGSEILDFSKIIVKINAKVGELIKLETGDLEQRAFTLVEREGIPLSMIKKLLDDLNIHYSDEKFQELFKKHKENSKNKKFSSPFSHIKHKH